MAIGLISRVCDQARADARAGRRSEPPHHPDHYAHAWKRERERMRVAKVLPQTEIEFCIVGPCDSPCTEAT